MAEKADYDLEYPLAGVFMDASRSPDNLPQGFCSRMVGVDGRFPGTVRKYPGHVLINTNSHLTNANAFRYVASYDVDEEEVTRGLLCRSGSDMYYYYYIPSCSARKSESITGPSGYSVNSANIDVAVKGEFIYIYTQGQQPFVMYDVAGSGWRYDFVGAYTDGGVALATDVAAAPAIRDDHATTGGYLHHRGRYKVMVKFYHSGRKVYSGRSKEYEFTLDKDTLETHLHGINIYDYPDGDSDDHLDEDFDYVEVYRTQNLRNPLSDGYNGAVYYREQLIERTEQGTISTVQVGTLDDYSLVLQKQYDPWMDPVEEAPDSAAACYYEGSVFAARDPDEDAGLGLVWTNPRVEGTEEFGSEFDYEAAPMDGVVKRIIKVGNYAFAVAGSVIYSITKVGVDVNISRWVEDKAVVNARCVAKIDRNLAVLTEQGLYFISAGGNCTMVGALDRILRDEWAGQLTNCEMAYDEAMGCLYILNPDVHEAICFWENTRSVSILEGVGASHITYGPDITGDTDTIRSYWYHDNGEVTTPDYDRGDIGGSPSHGMLGDATDIATVGEGGDEDTVAASMDAGDMVYVMSGTNAGKWGYSNGTTMSSGSPLGGAPTLVAGDTYLKNPVKVALRLWPVNPPVGTYSPRFARKVIKSIALKMTGLTGFGRSYADSSTDVKLGVYRNQRGRSDDSLEGYSTTSVSNNPSECVEDLNLDGVTLEPYIEQVSSGTDFELTGVLIVGTITVSKTITT